jgi:dCMP deaminase
MTSPNNFGLPNQYPESLYPSDNPCKSISLSPARPSIDQYFMAMAFLVSSRATCQEAKVGAVLVSSDRHVLATGYNGMLSGLPECDHTGSCKLTRARSNGETIKMCPTIHAEANALAQYRLAHNQPCVPQDTTIYVTTFPCLACVQQLIQAKVSKVIYGSSNSWEGVSKDYYDNQITFKKLELPWSQQDNLKYLGQL